MDLKEGLREVKLSYRQKALNTVSKVAELPLLKKISPAANRLPTEEELASYKACQDLAMQGAHAIAKMMHPGMTEMQVATLLDTYLLDHGVQGFFHKSFVWFGERTRFTGVQNYWDYQPSKRVLRENEPYILDVAPIYKGYISDIGYSNVIGQNAELEKMLGFLAELKQDIPRYFIGQSTGGSIWSTIDRRIREAGYENIHALYPFSVLGHRVHFVPNKGNKLNFIHFGWQSYWSFLSRGLFGQLLNQHHEGDLVGLWAIEPHLGNGAFGAKFEQLLYFDGTEARWL